MANNLIQIKRTSISGRAANTTTLPNPGELALNMTDGIMYSGNGAVVFEIGANTTNSRVTGNLTVKSIVANGAVGTAGQVLSSNGSVVYWTTPAASLTVNQVYGQGNTPQVSVSSVKTINFDNTTGFNVTDEGQGNVFVSLGSGFKTITVDGQDSIIAVGEDTLKVANGAGIILSTSNTAPKTLTISAAGAVGYAGSKGDSGYTGSAGLQGTSGYTGSQGPAGNDGYTGSKGDSGYTGSQGIQGTSGYTGSQGVTGADGYTGSKGDTGFTGSQGPQGSQGPAGTQGTTGYTGSDGLTGYTGSQGTIGYVGSKGDTGFTGSQGPAGQFGGAAFSYNFSSNTTHTSTPDGYFNFNNTAFGSVTTLFIDYLDALNANNYSFLQTIDDSTSAVKGHFSIRDVANSLNYAMFAITGAHTEEADHFDIPVSYLSGVTSFTNGTNTVVTFARTGDIGDTGYTGSTGFVGSQGNIGYTGSQGIQGTTGYVGSTGTTGFTGSFGSTGYTGSFGTTGYTGSKGDTGSQGTTGYTGSQGSLGYSGSQGNIGYTGSTGFTGSFGTTGYTGSKGDIGYSGSQGIAGYTGSIGIGYTGSAGLLGYTGSGGTGYTGSAGAVGYTGSSAQYLSANALSQSFTGNGSNTVYTLTTSVSSQNNIIVTLDGLVQTPATHYTISGTALTFTSAPINATAIEVRNFESGTGSSGSGGITTGKSIAMAIVFGG